MLLGQLRHVNFSVGALVDIKAAEQAEEHLAGRVSRPPTASRALCGLMRSHGGAILVRRAALYVPGLFQNDQSGLDGHLVSDSRARRNLADRQLDLF